MIEQLKKALLSTSKYVDNEYLDKYCQYVIEAKNNKEGEKHHVIPIHVYDNFTAEEKEILRRKIMHDKWNKKYKGNHYYVRLMREKKARKDKANFLVKLPRKEHYLAHAYLVLCSNEKFAADECLLVRSSEIGFPFNDEHSNKLAKLFIEWYHNN